MRLNIGSLVGRKGASFPVEEKISSGFVQFPPQIGRVVGPIHVQLVVTNTGEGYLVTGDLELEIALKCSRCLKPMRTTLRASVEEEFLNQPREEEDDEFWDEIPLVEANEVDLTKLMEESILMSVPMKAVCQPDCPGLCPTCGAVLAEETCDCLGPEIDIRLAPLSKLLHSLETKSPERRKDHGSTKEKTFKGKD